MPENKSPELIMEDRRREVSALRRQRLSLRKIVDVLARNGRANPLSGKPWGLTTIKKDVDALTAAARAESMRDISEHKSEVLADYHELMRLGWIEKRYDDVRLLLKDVRALLGTDSPQVIVFEQVQARMVEALTALEGEFANDPTTLERAIGALMGGPDRRATHGHGSN